MKFANNLDDIINAFDLEPLDGKDLEDYYYNGTMANRMGDPLESPLDELERRCTDSTESNAHLLLGHRGCGKSTELNRLRDRLREKGHPVTIIKSKEVLDILNLTYWDMMFVVSNALCTIAAERCALPDELLDRLKDFFKDIEITEEISKTEALDIHGGIEAATPKLLSVLKFFAGVRSELKTGYDRRTEIRERLKSRISDWIGYIKEIITHLAGVSKQPILIFEDLDKIPSPEAVWTIFNYGPLAQMPFPVIYTFPIDLSYDGKFNNLRDRFTPHILPLIKIRNLDGSENKQGIEIIKNIVKMRADVKRLFVPEALDLLIDKTGGLLRELFSCIDHCAFRALRRFEQDGGEARIDLTDAERTLVRLRSDLSRMIEERQYAMLNEIYWNPKAGEIIKNRNDLLELMQSRSVLEYNGERWCAVHPLIVDFLRNVGKLDCQEKKTA